LPELLESTMLTGVSFFERDIVRRMIQQLGEIAARVAGLSAQRRFDEALTVVRQSEQELLGPLSATLEAVDNATVRLLLGSDEKVGVWAVLLTERAKLLDARGDAAEARAVAKRALELFELLGPSGTASSELIATARTAARELAASATRELV
jgi:hypothetical protein